MTPAAKFTSELMIATARRGAAIPNPDGTLAIFFLNQHTTGEIVELIVDEKVTNVVWVGHDNHTLLCLSQGEGGHTWVKTVDVGSPSAEPTIVACIEAPVSDLKVKVLQDGSVAFVVVGLVDADGSLYNKEHHSTSHSARVTDSINPRVWDSYVRPQRHTLWHTTMVRQDSKWELVKPLRNVLAGTKLNAPPGVYEPMNHTDSFDICDDGILFAATEDDLADPTKTASISIYHLPLASMSTAEINIPNRISLHTDVATRSSSDQGWCSLPKFSPDGSIIAFLGAPTRSEWLSSSIWVKYPGSQSAVDVFTTITGKRWNLIPSGFEFAPDGHSLYVEIPDAGRVSLYAIDLRLDAVPIPIVRTGSVSSYHVLSPKDKDSAAKLLVTSSTLVEPWFCQIIETKGIAEPEPQVVSSISQHIDIGLSRKQISEIHFKGAGDYPVHAWVIRPNDFDSNKKYPLCVLVHGGPYAAWNDAWSTRWNPAVWAEQGYIVVTPNITGSEGFGLDMAAAIRNNWGGRPYADLVSCLDHLEGIPYIDLENAVAAGNSYGGYMMNWIQGQLDRRFKALVCHNGIFSLPNFLLESDTIAAMTDEFGGQPFTWRNSDGLERYNPARPDLLRNWKTPMLVIHSDKDYRVPVTQGLAAFHTLKILGTPARFLSFPDENHWVVKEENSLEWHRQVFTWINEWSGVTANSGNFQR